MNEWVLPVIAIWLGTGAVGMVLMRISDNRANEAWGLEPGIIRPDYILAGPLAFVFGVIGLWLTRNTKKEAAGQ